MQCWCCGRGDHVLLGSSFPEPFFANGLSGRFFFYRHQLVAELLSLPLEFVLEALLALSDALRPQGGIVFHLIFDHGVENDGDLASGCRDRSGGASAWLSCGVDSCPRAYGWDVRNWPPAGTSARHDGFPCASLSAAARPPPMSLSGQRNIPHKPRSAAGRPGTNRATASA